MTPECKDQLAELVAAEDEAKEKGLYQLVSDCKTGPYRVFHEKLMAIYRVYMDVHDATPQGVKTEFDEKEIHTFVAAARAKFIDAAKANGIEEDDLVKWGLDDCTKNLLALRQEHYDWWQRKHECIKCKEAAGWTEEAERKAMEGVEDELLNGLT